LFLRRNCSKRKEEGSSPQGLFILSFSNMLRAMRLLGRSPPSLAGRDNAILCLASSNRRRIAMRFSSGSFTEPNWSNRLGMGWCSLLGLLRGKVKGFLWTFCRTEGDLRP